MNNLGKGCMGVFLAIGCCFSGVAQGNKDWKSITLNDWQYFRDPGRNWHIAGGAAASLATTGDMKPLAGTGVAVNIVSGDKNTHLITKEEWGDMELEFDFMMSKGGHSGIYLQGRYEIPLTDSWLKTIPGFSDCGAISPRRDLAGKTGYEGVAPLVNASAAPGLWQHLRIKFRAPQFVDGARKTVPARFEEVYLNNVLVQDQVAVTGPTAAAVFEDEKTTGPLVFQGDQGNIAVRNIRYRQTDAKAGKPDPNPIYPITVNPGQQPYLLRSFLEFDGKKRTHVISVGFPLQMNYSYDLKQGALLMAWRGKYLDVTEMWHDRGEPQLAKPLGNVIPFSAAPTLAILANREATWPDSIAFDDMQNKGYTLDAKKSPAFRYSFSNISVVDKLVPSDDSTSLLRELNISGAVEGLYCRVIAADKIEAQDGELYAINDHSFYLRISKGMKPFIRQSGTKQEILIPIGKGTGTYTYSIIW
jgi:Domain of Unknown Function (DUF1080)